MGQIDLESDLPSKCSFLSMEAVATCFARGYPDSDTRHCTSFSVSMLSREPNKVSYPSVLTLGCCSLHELGERYISVWRCRATFEGTPMKACEICLIVMRRVQTINLIFTPKRKYAPLHANILVIVGINHTRTRHKSGCGIDGIDRHRNGLN